MSYTGYSVFQAAQISDSSARISAAELAIAQNLSTAVTKYGLLDAKDAEHDQFLSTLAGVKVDVSVFEAAVADSMAKNDEQDDRLTAVEGRATALESDIATRVEAEIQSKVSQVVFDSIHTELMNTDSALTSTLATKVAATVQTQLDEGQNSTIATKVAIADYNVYVSAATAAIASKVAQTDYDLYVSTNNALVATKYATADFNTFSTITSNRIGARVTLAQYNTDVAGFIDRMDGMDADIAARVTISQYTTEQSSQNAAIATKLATSTYEANKATTDAAIATKLATADYQSAKDSQDAVISSKVAQTDYDAYVNLNNTAVASKLATVDYEIHEAAQNAQIALKVAQSDFDGYVAANDAAVASKVAIVDYNAAQAAQDSAIASKVAQSEYDQVVAAVESLNISWEKRFIALEEFARALLATYTITKPDSTLYSYTAAPQNISVPPPVFSVTGKKKVGDNVWALVLQFSEYGYNAFLGDVVAWTSQGGIGFVRGQVNPQNRTMTLELPNSRSGSALVNYDLPFNIEYRDRSHTPSYTFQVTQAVFNGLPDVTPGPSTTPITILGVTYNGFGPSLIIAPHGDVFDGAFLFRNGQLVPYSMITFGAATTTTTHIGLPGSTDLTNLAGDWSYANVANVDFWNPSATAIKDDIAAVYTAPNTPMPVTGVDWTDLTNNADLNINNAKFSFITGASGTVKVFVRTDLMMNGENISSIWRDGTTFNLLSLDTTVTNKTDIMQFFDGQANVLYFNQSLNTTSTPNFVLNLLPDTKYYFTVTTYNNQAKVANNADDLSVKFVDSLDETNLAITYETGVTDYDTYALGPKKFALSVDNGSLILTSSEVHNGVVSVYYNAPGDAPWIENFMQTLYYDNESGVKTVIGDISGIAPGTRYWIRGGEFNTKISYTFTIV